MNEREIATSIDQFESTLESQAERIGRKERLVSHLQNQLQNKLALLMQAGRDRRVLQEAFECQGKRICDLDKELKQRQKAFSGLRQRESRLAWLLSALGRDFRILLVNTLAANTVRDTLVNVINKMTKQEEAQRGSLAEAKQQLEESQKAVEELTTGLESKDRELKEIGGLMREAREIIKDLERQMKPTIGFKKAAMASRAKIKAEQRATKRQLGFVERSLEKRLKAEPRAKQRDGKVAELFQRKRGAEIVLWGAGSHKTMYNFGT